MINLTILKELVHYDPETGIFTNKYSRGCSQKNKVLGTKDKKGYLQIRISYKLYSASRLAWFYFYGELPKHKIEHINKDKSDNRICNLRDCPIEKYTIRKTKSGIKGVYWSTQKQKFKATYRLNKKETHLGYFSDKYEAAKAYENFVKNLE